LPFRIEEVKRFVLEMENGFVKRFHFNGEAG